MRCLMHFSEIDWDEFGMVRSIKQDNPDHEMDIVFAVLDDTVQAIGQETLDEIWK